jgi:integrase
LANAFVVDCPERRKTPVRIASMELAPRLEALCVLAITTGMREGELLALRWRHVDLERGVVAVMGTAQRIRSEGLVIRETKTARSRRQVVLSATALAALGRHRVLQATERLRAGDRWEDLDLVFPNRVGRIQEATTLLQEEFYPLLERAGLARSGSMTWVTPRPR